MIDFHLFFNLFLLLFWVRFWVRPVNEFYFNPFLSGTTRLVDRILQFLYPVLRLQEQAAALLLLTFFVLFKTLFVLRFGGGVTLSLGMVFSFTPTPQQNSFGFLVLSGALQFGFFLVRLWTLYFLVRLLSNPTRLTRAAEAFAFFTRPFSLLPFLWQPVVLLLLHFCLTAMTISFGFIPNVLAVPIPDAPVPPPELFLTGQPIAVLLKMGWLSLMSFADGLMWMNNALMLAIMGILISMIFGLKTVMLIAMESTEVLLGRFSRRLTSAAGLDFTPMILFILVSFVYRFLQASLYQMITSPYVQ